MSVSAKYLPRQWPNVKSDLCSSYTVYRLPPAHPKISQRNFFALVLVYFRFSRFRKEKFRRIFCFARRHLNKRSTSITIYIPPRNRRAPKKFRCMIFRSVLAFLVFAIHGAEISPKFRFVLNFVYKQTLLMSEIRPQNRFCW